MTFLTRRACVLALGMIFFAGCAKGPAVIRSQMTPTSNGVASGGAHRSPGSVSSSSDSRRGADGSSASSTATPSPSAGGVSTPATALVVVRLSVSCIQPGGQQTVTVESRPGLQVTFNTRYADGKLGGDYGGIAVAQTIGPDGTYRNTWTLSLATSPGPATVTAGVASLHGERVSGSGQSTFTVSQKC